MTDTIFFDVGNTLRIVIPDKAFSDAAEKELMELVGATEPHDVFFEKLEKRWKKYRSEVKKTLIDAGEMELWSQHLLPASICCPTTTPSESAPTRGGSPGSGGTMTAAGSPGTM